MLADTKSPNSVEPVILIDSREKTPLPISRFRTERYPLYSGDYSIVGLESLFAVERKSIDDLAGCCSGYNRERLCRELVRLRGLRFRRLVVIGTREQILSHQYHSQIHPNSVLASLGAWEIRFDCPVVFCDTPEAAARQIESWVHWMSYEIARTATSLLKANGKEPAAI